MMAVKKILFLHQGTYWNRGSEKVLLGMLSALDKARFEAVLVCNHELLVNEAERCGIRTYRIGWPEVMIEKNYIKLQFMKVLKTVLRLRALIKTEKIDVLVCNSGLTTQTGYYAARLCRVPCVSFIHSPYTKRYIYLYRLHKSDLAVFVSHAIMVAMNEKVTFSHGLVIHNGIDTDKYMPAVTRNKNVLDGIMIDETTPVIGQVGSLIYRKGVDLLIEAGKKLAERGVKFHVVLVGCGSDEATFIKMVKEYSLERYFTFYGDTESPELFYKHIFDINVLASRSEAFGLTMAEGAACGLPCVGANIEGIPEVMRDNVTGLLFEPGNAEDLANKLEMLINSPVRRKELGQNGRIFVINQLSMSKQINEFNDALLRLA